eukprot:5133444-Amphidinium_carterae.1
MWFAQAIGQPKQAFDFSAVWAAIYSPLGSQVLSSFSLDARTANACVSLHSALEGVDLGEGVLARAWATATGLVLTFRLRLTQLSSDHE